MFKIHNAMTNEVAALVPNSERYLAEKLFNVLRRNDLARRKREALAWTVTEIPDDDVESE